MERYRQRNLPNSVTENPRFSDSPRRGIFRKIPVRFPLKNGSGQAVNRFLVTENHNLAGIFYRPIPPAIDLFEKKCPTGETLYINQISPDDTPFYGGFRVKECHHPSLGVRKKRASQLHPATLIHVG
ncbi:MAG: hypothetical protein AAF686_04520 [Pseudomonadota bacterium]